MPEQLPEEIYATFAGSIDQHAISRMFGSFPIAINDGVKTVHLLINSLGGFVADGIAAYNYLRNLPLSIVTYNGGSVASIAVIMFLAGQTRKCSPNATFMIHKTTFSMPQAQTAFDLRHRADAAEMDDNNTDSILRSQIHMPDSNWNMRDRCDLTISAQDAKKFGLVHEIADFQPPAGTQLFNI